MELADTGVGILNVCPGPVDTPFMRELFGKEIVQKKKVCSWQNPSSSVSDYPCTTLLITTMCTHSTRNVGDLAITYLVTYILHLLSLSL